MCWQAGWAGPVRVLSTSNNSSRLHGLQHVPTWLLMNSDLMTVTGALKRHLGQHTVQSRAHQIVLLCSCTVL
jgi:hypothetical protein